MNMTVVPVTKNTLTSQTRTLPEGLVFFWVDDDEMPRIFAKVVLAAARADMSSSQIIGEEFSEASTCPQRVMALASTHGEDCVIVVLDQNIEYSEGALYGTELCMQIRALGFRGTMLINSANDELQDERDYLQAGADGSIGKGISGGVGVILAKLAELHHVTCSSRLRPAT